MNEGEFMQENNLKGLWIPYEILSNESLNDKEKFWISFYHGQDFGYNITKGGSQRISN